MTQTRLSSGYTRKILKEIDTSHVPEPWWFAEALNNPYHAYGPLLNSQIENQYRDFLVDNSKTIFKFKLFDWSYELDFTKMTQKNMKTGRERKVFREVF